MHACRFSPAHLTWHPAHILSKLDTLPFVYWCNSDSKFNFIPDVQTNCESTFSACNVVLQKCRPEKRMCSIQTHVMSDLWELVDICHHQEHHSGGGALPQPKAGLKSGGKAPPYGRNSAP